MIEEHQIAAQWNPRLQVRNVTSDNKISRTHEKTCKETALLYGLLEIILEDRCLLS